MKTPIMISLQTSQNISKTKVTFNYVLWNIFIDKSYAENAVFSGRNKSQDLLNHFRVF